VHAAETPGGEDPDPGALRQVRGRGDRGCAVPAERDRRRQVADADLLDGVAVGEVRELIVGEPDARHTAEHGDGRGHGPFLGDRALGLPSDREVLRPRQAVADDRAFQRDDGPAGAEGIRDVGPDPHHFGHCAGHYAGHCVGHCAPARCIVHPDGTAARARRVAKQAINGRRGATRWATPRR
jgi:hypothetical protein